MEIIIGIGFFLLGLSVGSFLNVVIFRLGSEESVLWGRSHCVKCVHVLEWFELIPVASFLFLGGRCRVCHERISLRYPFVEIITGAFSLFLWLGYQNFLFFQSPFSALTVLNPGSEWFFYSLGILYYLLAGWILLAIAAYDFRTFIIPPVFIWPLMFLGVINQVLMLASGLSIYDVMVNIGAALFAFLFFAMLWFFSRGRAMGFGDAELSAAIFLILGPWLGVAATLISFWSGALFGLILMGVGQAQLKSRIPFGPFLALGAAVSLFWGEKLMQGYFLFFRM